MSIHEDTPAGKPAGFVHIDASEVEKFLRERKYQRDLTITIKLRGSRAILLAILNSLQTEQIRYTRAKAVQKFEVDWK